MMRTPKPPSPISLTPPDAVATDDADADADATADSSGDDTASTQELTAELAELRSKYEVLERQVATTHQPKRSLRPSKYFVSMLCVVLGAILLPFAVIARWTTSTVLDTDAYVETVAPLAQDEDIQEALSYRVSVIILDAIDFRQQAEDALPTAAGFPRRSDRVGRHGPGPGCGRRTGVDAGVRAALGGRQPARTRRRGRRTDRRGQRHARHCERQGSWCSSARSPRRRSTVSMRSSEPISRTQFPTNAWTASSCSSSPRISPTSRTRSACSTSCRG